MALRLVQVNVKARDDAALGRFWAAALGWRVAGSGSGATPVHPEGFVWPDPDVVSLDVVPADSPNRRTAMKAHGPWRESVRKVSPVWAWRIRHVRQAHTNHSCPLSPEYEWFGRSFDGLDLRFLDPSRQCRLRDFKRILEWSRWRTWSFPLPDSDQNANKAGTNNDLMAPARRSGRGGHAPVQRDTLVGLNAQPEPDPLADVAYTGDADRCAVRAERRAAGLPGPRQARGAEVPPRHRLRVLVRPVLQDSRGQERFLRRAKLFAIGDKYLDGYAVARVLGVPMDDQDQT